MPKRKASSAKGAAKGEPRRRSAELSAKPDSAEKDLKAKKAAGKEKSLKSKPKGRKGERGKGRGGQPRN